MAEKKAPKKRFTFADAKAKIKELEAALEDAQLKQDDNVYDAGEQKFIKFYQWGFYILAVAHIVRFLM